MTPSMPRPRLRLAAALALCLAGGARADDSGCDKFAWPVEREAAALSAPALTVLPNGAAAGAAPRAFALALAPTAAAGLPKEPQRHTGAANAFAGFTSFDAPAAGGLYQVTLSAYGWVDIIQGGDYVKPVKFSGATDCPGARKSLRYMLKAAPFTFQLSGAESEKIGVMIAPVAAGPD